MGERTFAKERDRLRDALGELAGFAHKWENSAVAEAARVRRAFQTAPSGSGFEDVGR
jgi:hypothetical protein